MIVLKNVCSNINTFMVIYLLSILNYFDVINLRKWILFYFFEKASSPKFRCGRKTHTHGYPSEPTPI